MSDVCMACGDEPRELVSTWATCLGERQIVSLCRRCYSARMGIRDAVELAWDRQYLQQKTRDGEDLARELAEDLAENDVDAGASFNAGAEICEKGNSNA